MKCPKCGDSFRIVRTYSAGEAAKTHGAKCEGCGTRATIVSEIYMVDPTHGQGAAAVAQRIRAGLRRASARLGG